MYVCICSIVTEKEIFECIKKGAQNMRQIRNQCGACSDCGKCANMIKQLLETKKDDDEDAYLCS